MSKKTQLAKREQKRLPPTAGRKQRNPGLMFGPFPSSLIFGGLFGMFAPPIFSGGGNYPRQAAPPWHCYPCNLDLTIPGGTNGDTPFCPKCRNPMTAQGQQTRVTVDYGPNVIEAKCEDITHERLPAPSEKKK